MNSLDKNVFYNSLLTTFRKKYEEASEKRFLICIPNDDCLEASSINDKVVDAHILKPSPLLKSHYMPANERQYFDIEINDREVIVTRGNETEKITILGEEIAYNSRNQPYRLLMVENSLININKKSNEVRKKVSSDNEKFISFDNCKKFLGEINEEKTKMIENKTIKLINTYVILPNYIQDAADRLKSVIDWGIELIISNTSKDLPVESAVEGFVTGLAYSKLFPAIIKQNLYEDQLLEGKFNSLMKLKIKPTHFGAQTVFSTFIPNDSILSELLKLSSLITPMEKLRCLRRTLDLINEQVNKMAKDVISPLTGQCDAISVTSDDLIPIVICVLAAAQLQHLSSEIFFMKTFSWYLSHNNEYGYSLVTFEVAKEFMKKFDLKELDSQNINTQNLPDALQKNSLTDRLLENDAILDISPLDRELEKIAKMIDASKDEPTSTSDKNQEQQDNDLGGFLTSLSQNAFIVGFGKQQ